MESGTPCVPRRSCPAVSNKKGCRHEAGARTRSAAWKTSNARACARVGSVLAFAARCGPALLAAIACVPNPRQTARGRYRVSCRTRARSRAGWRTADNPGSSTRRESSRAPAKPPPTRAGSASPAIARSPPRPPARPSVSTAPWLVVVSEVRPRLPKTRFSGIAWKVCETPWSGSDASSVVRPPKLIVALILLPPRLMAIATASNVAASGTHASLRHLGRPSAQRYTEPTGPAACPIVQDPAASHVMRHAASKCHRSPPRRQPWRYQSVARIPKPAQSVWLAEYQVPEGSITDVVPTATIAASPTPCDRSRSRPGDPSAASPHEDPVRGLRQHRLEIRERPAHATRPQVRSRQTGTMCVLCGTNRFSSVRPSVREAAT